MANGDRKPGEAIADRIREAQSAVQSKFRDAVKDHVDQWDTPTSPQVVINLGDRDSLVSGSKSSLRPAELKRKATEYRGVLSLVLGILGGLGGTAALTNWVGAIQQVLCGGP